MEKYETLCTVYEVGTNCTPGLCVLEGLQMSRICSGSGLTAGRSCAFALYRNMTSIQGCTRERIAYIYLQLDTGTMSNSAQEREGHCPESQ